MKRPRTVVSGLMLTIALLVLTGCSPAVPVAYHVAPGVVDVAVCEEFRATEVVIEFSNYPPFGSRTVFAEIVRSGDRRHFEPGVPISATIEGWELSSGSSPIPSDWERVDFSFYDGPKIFVDGIHLFRRDVVEDEWAWTRGVGVLEPACELQIAGAIMLAA